MEAVEDYNSGEAENKERTPFPPYHKVPNSIYEAGLNHFEIVVYCYLSRRMGKIGAAYPKLETICQETGIKAKGTIRKALRSLIRRGFIEMVLPATHRIPARYKVRPFAVEAAAAALARGNHELGDPSEVHRENPELRGEYPEQKGVKTTQRGPSDEPQRFMERTPEVHGVNLGGSREIPEGRILFKEDSVKEDTEKEKSSPPLFGAPPPQGDSALVLSGESTPSPSPALGEFPSNQESLLTKTNRYYHALSQTEKETFDREARRIRRSKSMPSLVELRELRSNFFGLMQFAQQTYFPSADAVETAAKVLEESRAARIAEIELEH